MCYQEDVGNIDAAWSAPANATSFCIIGIFLKEHHLKLMHNITLIKTFLPRLMLTSVRADLVIMAPPVLTSPKATPVSVKRASPGFSARTRSATVWRAPALTAPCAKTCLAPTTSSVCVETASRARTVTSPLTLALRMAILVAMEPRAGLYLRAATPVSVQRAGRADTARITLMIVWSSLVCWELTVQTWSMTSAATVPEASLGRGVRPR